MSFWKNTNIPLLRLPKFPSQLLYWAWGFNTWILSRDKYSSHSVTPLGFCTYLCIFVQERKKIRMIFFILLRISKSQNGQSRSFWYNFYKPKSDAGLNPSFPHECMDKGSSQGWVRRITFIFIFNSSKNIAKFCLAKLIFGVEFSPLYTFRDCRTLKNKKFTLEVAILETHDHIVGLC